MRTDRFFTTPWLILLLACGPTGGPTPPRNATCVDIQAIPPSANPFSGPFFNLGALQFENPKIGTTITPVFLVDRPEDLDGKPELYVSHSEIGGSARPLIMNFPGASFPRGVGEIWVRLQHFNHAQLTASGFGTLISKVGQPTQKVKAYLHLAGGGPINRVVIEAAEVLLYEVCWTT